MLEPLIIFLSFAALGIFQAAPSVTTGDAGEFAAAAASWGVPHAPGYATWTVLAKALGTALPLGDWAYRANVLSALCGAAALVLLCNALRRWGVPRAARVGAVVLLGLAPLWREQSAVAEAFSLLALSGAALLWIVAAAGERLLSPGPAAALGLVFGLGLGAHQTLVLVLPALLLAGKGLEGSWARALAWAGLGTMLGFGVHLAIPLRAMAGPPVDWGHAVNGDAFLRLILRKDYGTFALTIEGAQELGAPGLWAQAWRFITSMYRGFGAIGILLAAVGALAWSRTEIKLKAGTAAMWVLAAGPGFLFLGRPGFDAQTAGALERFYLLPMMGLVPFLAAGFAVLGRRVPAFAVVAALMAGAAAMPEGFAASRRTDFLEYDYGRAIMRTIPVNGILVMDGGDDTFYGLMFLKVASGLRPDVQLHDRGGVVFPGGYGADFRALEKNAKAARRLEVETRWYGTGRLWYSTLNDGLLPGVVLAPAGLLRRPVPTNAKFAEGPALRETLVVRMDRGSIAKRYRDRALAAFIPHQRGVEALARGDTDAGVSWFEVASMLAPDALWIRPTQAYALGMHGFHRVNARDYAGAERAYRLAAELEPHKAEPLTNLGVTLERKGRLEEAEAAFREGIRREPRSPLPHAALGARLWGAQRWAEAAAAFDAAAALAPSDDRSAAWADKARRRAAAK